MREEPVPQSFDEEDERLANEDTAHAVVDEQHVEVQRYVGQHIHRDGREEHFLPPFQQEPQHPQLDEDGGDEGDEELQGQLSIHSLIADKSNVASRYPGISDAASSPNANPSLPLINVFAQ